MSEHVFLFVLRNKYMSLPLIMLDFFVTFFHIIIINHRNEFSLIYVAIKNGAKVQTVKKDHFSRLFQTVLILKSAKWHKPVLTIV